MMTMRGRAFPARPEGGPADVRERRGAAEGTRTPDPIITNDVGWTPTSLKTKRFLLRQLFDARMLQESVSVPQSGFEPKTPSLRMKCSTS